MKDINELQLTPGKEEGPYYSAGSPETKRLWSTDISGEKLTLSGKVMDIKGNPLVGAWLDFWQADGNGRYDNEGYTLRGHQYTDKNGSYTLETVIPGKYPGRTPHIHVKAGANEKTPTLTTQLFIPGISTNQRDFLFLESLLIKIAETPKGKMGTFDFVVQT
jgi:protocatechuate 3,4-dioxygenase beta subunit